MGNELDSYWVRIKAGDKNALGALFKRVYAPLCYYSKQITHDIGLAEEVVMEVFEKIWYSREIISIHSSFKSYLFQSVRNCSINEVKKRDAAKNVVNKTVSDAIWKTILENHESQDYIIEKITSEDTVKIIEKAIESLPPQCRQIFHLSRDEDKTNNEIAGIMNISVNTVKAHIFQALRKIREALTPRTLPKGKVKITPLL